MHDETHQHTAPTRHVERHCDVAVVGGSAAGLAAALQLGRQRRSVIVIDAGEPRNAPATHMHGYLGFEGRPPSDLVAVGRDEVRRYGGEVLAARAIDVTRTADGFRVALAGGHAVVARRVLVATGIVDELPAIDGLAEHWGGQVIHCPFCHGYEARDRRIVQIVTHPMALHPTPLYRQLTHDLTVVLHRPEHDGPLDPDPSVLGVDVDPARLTTLRDAGITVIEASVARIVDDADGHVTAVELADGRRLAADVVAIGPRFRPRVEAFATVGLRPSAHPSGLGDVVTIDATGATEIPGLFAAGNVTDPSQQVAQAMAEGSRVGAMISFSLAEDELAVGGTTGSARRSANATDWDHRYEHDRMWSGNPNGTLVTEVSGMPPGRALDVGAGEGGDAIWLAEQGWDVTASDISARALDRLAVEAERRGLDVTCQLADANSLDPFEPGAFDLVSAQYASIPRTPDARAVRNLLAAVAPGGTLLVVSHDLAPMRTGGAHDHDHPHEHGQVFDPDAYVRVDDVVAALADDPDWEIVTHDTRVRPPGAASVSHHVGDVVFRVRRVRVVG